MNTPQTSTNISGLTQPLRASRRGGRNQNENKHKWRERKLERKTKKKTVMKTNRGEKEKSKGAGGSFRIKRPGDLNFSILMYQNTFDTCHFSKQYWPSEADRKRFCFFL